MERLVLKWNVDFDLHGHKNQTIISKVIDDIEAANTSMLQYPVKKNKTLFKKTKN